MQLTRNWGTQMKIKRSFLGKLIHYFWSIFLNGLLAILPITVTATLFTVTFRVITGWLEPLRQFVPPQLDELIPYYAEVLIAIGFVFFIGTLLKIFVARSIIHAAEDLVARLPLVRPIYTGIKQLVKALSMQDQMSFKQVVMIEFPRKGIYSLGFLTSELLSEIAPDTQQTYVNIFIPTTPNPTSGYFIIVPIKDVIIVNITRQEAMAMIISGGILQPKSSPK